MTELEALKEKAGRYKRLSENQDFIKTVEEMDEFCRFDQNVFGVLKTGMNEYFIVAKEGARAYSDKLKGLANEYEYLVANYNEPEEGDIDE